MGCSFSCESSSVCKNLGVAHLNGHVKEYDYPVSVGEVTAKQPKNFACICAQLLSTCSPPLMTYAFLEPYSVFQSNASPAALAPQARKLTNIAKSCPSKSTSGHRTTLIGLNGARPACRSPAGSPDRFSDSNLKVETENCSAEFERTGSSKSRSWKPNLSTIRERSFSQRTESNLQENI